MLSEQGHVGLEKQRLDVLASGEGEDVADVCGDHLVLHVDVRPISDDGELGCGVVPGRQELKLRRGVEPVGGLHDEVGNRWLPPLGSHL